MLHNKDTTLILHTIDETILKVFAKFPWRHHHPHLQGPDVREVLQQLNNNNSYHFFLTPFESGSDVKQFKFCVCEMNAPKLRSIHTASHYRVKLSLTRVQRSHSVKFCSPQLYFKKKTQNLDAVHCRVNRSDIESEWWGVQ